MLDIKLSKYQAIVARSAIADRLPEYRKYRDEAPGFARAMCADHVEAMEGALASLNDALDAVSVPREEVTE